MSPPITPWTNLQHLLLSVYVSAVMLAVIVNKINLHIAEGLHLVSVRQNAQETRNNLESALRAGIVLRQIDSRRMTMLLFTSQTLVPNSLS